MRQLLALFLIAPLAACDGGAGGNSTAISIHSEEGDGNTSFTARDGKYAIKAPGFSGSFKLPGIAIAGDDLDIDGIKLPPKSRITSIDAHDGKGGDDRATMKFETEMAPAETLDWLKRKMLARGYRVESRGSGLAGATRDGSRFTVDLVANGSGTAGTYVVTG